MLANAPNAIRNRSHNAYIIARGAISSVLKEVQKYTMTKEKRLGWIYEECTMRYKRGSSIKNSKYFKHNVS